MKNRLQSHSSIPQGYIPEKSRTARAYFPIRTNDGENAYRDLRIPHGLKSQGAGSLGGESLLCCCPFSMDHCSENYHVPSMRQCPGKLFSVSILNVSFWTVASSSSSWDKSKPIHHRWGTEKMGQGWWLVEHSIKWSAAETLSSGQRNRGQWDATVLP